MLSFFQVLFGVISFLFLGKTTGSLGYFLFILLLAVLAAGYAVNTGICNGASSGRRGKLISKSLAIKKSCQAKLATLDFLLPKG